MQYVSLVIMTVFYLVASVRYFPDNVQKTMMETTLHVVSIAPFTIGCTMFIVICLQKASHAKLPWDRVARIFLMLAILFEVILGFQHYVGKA